MITAIIRRNKAGRIAGFDITNHGKKEVCAAVSALAINAVNSIETLTSAPFACDYDPAGGYLHFELPRASRGETDPKADLLLESMLLGLVSVQENYQGYINILDEPTD